MDASGQGVDVIPSDCVISDMAGSMDHHHDGDAGQLHKVGQNYVSRWYFGQHDTCNSPVQPEDHIHSTEPVVDLPMPVLTNQEHVTAHTLKPPRQSQNIVDIWYVPPQRISLPAW